MPHEPHEPRDEATVLAELAEVERHLHEVPPHHGGGTVPLRDQAVRLRRELARMRAAQET